MIRYHDLLHRIGGLIGHDIPIDAPDWLHAILHVILIWAPLALVGVLGLRIGGRLANRGRRAMERAARRGAPVDAHPLPTSVFRYVIGHTRGDQLRLIALGLVSLPVLYATLELPKLIVNGAIDAPEHTTVLFGYDLDQTAHLFVLSGTYLLVLLVNGVLKFVLNVYKGRVAERLLRRLRLTVLRLWRRRKGAGRTEIIPLISQEVEPIGGFAADALALPVFQGGTFATILLFMFVQDPYLGAAALVLLPVQIALIPKLQRRLNRHARTRMLIVRRLAKELGERSAEEEGDTEAARRVGTTLKDLEAVRLRIHWIKFFMKALNNFLTSMTPFFFYSIGGYLVIQGQLSLGALVAVLAAYKDFSAPLKEMFRYYQSREDVRIRFEEVRLFVSARRDEPVPVAAQ